MDQWIDGWMAQLTEFSLFPDALKKPWERANSSDKSSAGSRLVSHQFHFISLFILFLHHLYHSHIPLFPHPKTSTHLIERLPSALALGLYGSVGTWHSKPHNGRAKCLGNSCGSYQHSTLKIKPI